MKKHTKTIDTTENDRCARTADLMKQRSKPVRSDNDHIAARALEIEGFRAPRGNVEWISPIISGFGVRRLTLVRTVKTASGATAVQVVWSSRRGSRDIEHVDSAHDDEELETLKAAANQRLAAGQGELDLGLDAAAPGPLEIATSRVGHFWDALCRVNDALGFDQAAGGDEVFRQLVQARIIEPTSKQDSLRVLEEVGVGAGVVPHAEPPAGGLRPRVLAPWSRGHVREACGAGLDVAGVVRRVHVVLRDRPR